MPARLLVRILPGVALSAEARRALATIRECIEAENYSVTIHFSQRMQQRFLFWPDVQAVVTKHLNAGAMAERDDLVKLNASLQADLAKKGLQFVTPKPAETRELPNSGERTSLSGSRPRIEPAWLSMTR